MARDGAIGYKTPSFTRNRALYHKSISDQDKKLISQDEEGSYVIHDAILDKARELKIMQ